MSNPEGGATDAKQEEQPPPDYNQENAGNGIQIQYAATPQPVQQVVVVQQQQQQQNYHLGNNANATMDVNGSLMMKNLNYFNTRDDTGNYEENMKPWEVDGQSYDFACYTNHTVEIGQKKVRQNLTANLKWEISVYRKTGSNRLIIKRKDYENSLLKATNNPLIKWAIAVASLGVLLIAIGIAAESGETAGIGAVILVAGIVMGCCFQRNKIQRQESTMTSQSIPISSIYYVERKVETLEEQKQCCCAPEKDKGVQYSWISIGYSRSNLSTVFNSAASKDDYVSFQLISNQAYNLHQYVNAIIDGGNPEFNRGGYKE